MLRMAPSSVGWKLFALVTAVACPMLAIGACGTSTGTNSSAKNYVIGSMQNDLTNPFEAVLGKAEQTEAAKLGITLHLVSGNVSGTVSDAAQISEVENFISEKVNLIVVGPSDPNAMVPIIKKANTAGIPVIAVNSEVGPGAKTVTYVGANNYTYGYDEGLLTAKALNDKGQVALILGVLGSSITTDRTNGFKAAIAKYPGISIVAQPNDNWTNSLNIQVVQELTSRYSNGGLNAIVGEGFQMFAGADWAYTHGIKNIQFISGDYAVQTEAAIKSGALYGSVEQDPGQQGTLAVQYAYDWLTGHRSDVPQPIAYTPLPMITKSNVAKYPSTWSA